MGAIGVGCCCWEAATQAVSKPAVRDRDQRARPRRKQKALLGQEVAVQSWLQP